MIVDKRSYLFVKDKFKLVSAILYDDLIKLGSDFLLANDFNKVEKCIEVDTTFKKIYLRDTQTLYFKDFLTNEFGKKLSTDLYIEDKVYFPFNIPNYEVEKFDVQEYLYLNTFNYSTAFSDIVNKYKLPKDYLLKALSTGCPDDEFSKAKEYNNKLKILMAEVGVENEEDFRDYILKQYSSNIKNVKCKMTNGLLDLVYTCISGNYNLQTHTTLELFVYNQDTFSNIVSFLNSFSINKTITNSVFNKRDCSIISINSSLIYNLITTEFNNYEFLLKLSKKNSLYLISKLNDNFYNFKQQLSGYYLQEFLYSHSKLYKLEDNLLTPVKNYEVTTDGFLVPVVDVTKIISTNLIDIHLI